MNQGRYQTVNVLFLFLLKLGLSRGRSKSANIPVPCPRRPLKSRRFQTARTSKSPASRPRLNSCVSISDIAGAGRVDSAGRGHSAKLLPHTFRGLPSDFVPIARFAPCFHSAESSPSRWPARCLGSGFSRPALLEPHCGANRTLNPASHGRLESTYSAGVVSAVSAAGLASPPGRRAESQRHST